MMFGLGSPWWLAALALVPLIRWLHRWQAPLNNIPVTALFLWNHAASDGSGGEMQKQPDPAWRRRAAIVALLAISLAEPWWDRPGENIVVWIDDSMSMWATDQSPSRLHVGLSMLRDELPQSAAANVTIRSLSDPLLSFPGDDPRAFDTGSWRHEPPADLQLPPPILLEPNSAHWLVSDGADQALTNWAKTAPLTKIISVGNDTENVALTRLSARPDFDKPGFISVLISVSNMGSATAERELTLTSGNLTLDSLHLELSAGETRHLLRNYAIGSGDLTASLAQDDVLSLDDTLALQAPVIERIPVGLDEACPAPLLRALRSHPMLSVVAATESTSLLVTCSSEARAANAVIRFQLGAASPLPDAIVWHGANTRLRELYLLEQWTAATSWEESIDAGDEVLASSDSAPLVVRRSGDANMIETVIDISQPIFVQQPEYAVFIAGLVDTALGQSLLDATAGVTLDRNATRIMPATFSNSVEKTARKGLARQSLTALFLSMACLLLIGDLYLLWSAGRNAHHA